MTDTRDVKLALVVDDSVMQCKVLSVLLKEEGYRVFSANDGARGVAMYIKYHPDLVLMDINMPVMNGFEAARKIKSFSPNSLAPLIFITSMDTDEAFIEAVEAGGDGILVRPFSPEVFKAKIKSIQRISDLYSQVKKLQQEQQNDAEIAEQLMSGVIEARNFALDKIGIIKQAAELFSGDLQLTALCPNGDVNVLLGDFTGHGLRSSIGAIPVAETFRTMSKKGFSLFEIITQINRQLSDLLPADLFFAAGLVSISSHDDSAYIFNAGIPDIYHFDQQGVIKNQVSSFHPPLGVIPSLLDDIRLSVVSIEKSDRIILISDGIVEARNEQGEMFDFERFESAATSGVINSSVTRNVLLSINDFCQSMPQEDDISLIDIPCGGWERRIKINRSVDTQSESYNQELYALVKPSWKWSLSLTGKRLSNVNPVPMAMNQINDIEGAGEHWQSMYTILTELFVNALDHGVLGLNSSLKSNAEGFAQYFKEREKRLSVLDTGFVDINLSYYPLKVGGKMVISLKDSGVGFDSYKYFKIKSTNYDESDGLILSGRGIELVEKLCDSIEYQDDGTLVEAVYVWAN